MEAPHEASAGESMASLEISAKRSLTFSALWNGERLLPHTSHPDSCCKDQVDQSQML